MNAADTPRFPLYIVSKGRWDTRLTAKHLEAMRTKFFIVVEEQERAKYEEALAPGGFGTVLVLDRQFQLDYDAFDELGMTKSKGPGPARNFAWWHSMQNGHAWHWVMDDNIQGFYRFNRNLKIKCATGFNFWCMEEFTLRFANVGMTGPNYRMFVPRKQVVPPFTTNTRIYSCNLIRNDTPFRWRGRYNEDTDLSLRMLKAGWCTIQFNAFQQFKIPTQTIGGGNTAEFYANEGTLEKSAMQVAMHPDVSRMVHRFGRIHHHVDYRPFKALKLIRKGEAPPIGVNEFGKRLVIPEGNDLQGEAAELRKKK
jgi:hypothetical protein